MAEAILSVTLETLRDLLWEEAKFLHGVSDQVREIKAQLEMMKSFLKDADKRQYEDESISTWVRQVRRLAYRIEDILEMYGVEVASRRGKGLKNVLKRFACVFSESSALHKVGIEIAAIKSEITNLKTDREAFGIRDLHEGENSRENQRLRRQTYAHQVEEHFVGMKDDIRELLSLTTDNEGDHRMISIWGIGGLGKTTLARKIFNHTDVRQSFESFAWVCITQQCEIHKVLQDIIGQLGGGVQGDDPPAMVRELHSILEMKNCLVVIDDIWRIEDWEILYPAFATTNRSSKVLLTTRIGQVATKGHCYEPKCLTEEEGWELLRRKALTKGEEGRDVSIKPEFERIGKEIVRKCGYLPLAISVLGGTLQEKSSVREWEILLNDMDLYLKGRRGNLQGATSQSVHNVLGLSYDELPYYLKLCFLYLGRYEEDQSIEVVHLYHQWIAEGLVLSEHRGGEESMMDVAEQYLDELASRCMVEIEMDEVFLDPMRKCLRLHDLMRDLCLAKGKEEEFWKVIDLNDEDFLATDLFSQSHDHGRRLHMHAKVEPRGENEILAMHEEGKSRPTIEIPDKVFEKVQGEPIRTLFVVRDFTLYWYLRVELRRLKKFKLLRVLQLEGCELESSEGISQLIYLRYLSVRLSNLKELPASISHLSYLQTLDLGSIFDIYLPNIFWKMKRLRHIYLPLICYNVLETLEFRDMSELETLSGFDCTPDTPGHLSGLTNLRYFHGSIDANAFSDQMVDEIRSWTKIKWLYIYMSGSNNSDNSNSSSALLRKLLLCQNLTDSRIEYIPIGKFPPYETDFWPNLSDLVLDKTKMEEDPMQFLKNLPKLRWLSLEDAFVGKEMFCDAAAFPQLRHLELRELPNLMKWRVDAGAMPNLFKLTIFRCSKLETITDGLNLSALKEFHISEVPEEFERKYKMLHQQARNQLVK